MARQYRVVSKREGVRPIVKVFATLRGARHRLTLLGPEPWLAYRRTADDICRPEDGLTEREYTAEIRADMPALEYVRLESREVGEWVACEAGQ